MDYLPADERYRALLTAVVRAACDDVRSHCVQQRKGLPRNSYAARMRKEYSHQTAVKSLAWLTGVRPGELPIRMVCRALGLSQTRLLDRLEEAVGSSRFVELSEMAVNLFGARSGDAA